MPKRTSERKDTNSIKDFVVEKKNPLKLSQFLFILSEADPNYS